MGQDGAVRADGVARDGGGTPDGAARDEAARSDGAAAPRTVVVLFGGRSSEHSISCATAGGVLAAIDRDRYRVIPVGITRDGAWVLEDDDPAKFTLADDAAQLPEVLDNGTRVRLPDSARHREVTVSEAGGGPVRSLGEVDIVLPLLHGPYGEDGTVQGMLSLAGVPFAGSGVLAASLAMDKHYAKVVLRAAGLRVADGITVAEREWREDPAGVMARAEGLGFPAFVKPARAGSSVGVSKVKDAAGYEQAMRTAFAEDDRVLVEAAVTGREVEIAILESMPGQRPRASAVAGEIVMTGAEFYDFESKYLGAAGVELRCPADLTPQQLAEMAELGVRAFEALGVAGLARVDFFLTEDGFVLNEINTMPGFTPISMFPKCWEASGMSYQQLITELLEVALAHAEAAREAAR